MRLKLIFVIGISVLVVGMAGYFGWNYKRMNQIVSTANFLSYTNPEIGISFNIPNGYAMSDWRDISGRADQMNIFAEIYKTNPDGTAIDAPPVLAFERVRGLPMANNEDLLGLGVIKEIKPINLNCGQGKILTVETEDYGGEKIIYHVYAFHDGQNLFRLSGWEGVDWPGADEFVNSIKLLNCAK